MDDSGASVKVLIALLVVLGACGRGSANAPDAAPPEAEVPPGQRIEHGILTDGDYRFTLRAPGGYRLAGEDEMSGSVFRAKVYSDEVTLVVEVSQAPRPRLDDVADKFARESGTEPKRTDITFAGKSARRFEGEAGYHYCWTVFASEGFVYSLRAREPAGLAEGCGRFDPLFESFHLLDGKPRARLPSMPITDVIGAGTRLRGRVFEDAVGAFRLRAPPDAAFVTGVLASVVGELPLDHEMQAPEIAVVFAAPVEARLILHAARNYGAARHSAHHTAKVLGGQVGAERTLRMFGRPTKLREVRIGNERRFVGNFDDGDIWMGVTIHCAAGLEEQAFSQVEALLPAGARLSGDEAASLAKALRLSDRDENRFEGKHVLRGGRWLDFEHTYSWSMPSATWVIASPTEEVASGPGVGMVALERMSGTQCTVFLDTVASGATPKTYHDSLLSRMTGTTRGDTRAITVSGKSAFATVGTVAKDGQNRQATIVTLTSGSQGFVLACASRAGAPGAEEAVTVFRTSFELGLRGPTPALEPRRAVDVPCGYTLATPPELTLRVLPLAEHGRDVPIGLGPPDQWKEPVAVLNVRYGARNVDTPTGVEQIYVMPTARRHGLSVQGIPTVKHVKIGKRDAIRYRYAEKGAEAVDAVSVLWGKQRYTLIASQGRLDSLLRGFSLHDH